MKLTNKSLGPKAITTTDRGVVVLGVGESADLNVGDDDAAAIKRHQLLEAPEPNRTPSLADLQREIASNALGGGIAQSAELTAAEEAEANLPAADDPHVVALVDQNNSQELQKIVADEAVDVTGARNKNDTARRIVAKRRAAGGGTGGAEGQLPAEDDADVTALVDGNDEDQLRQLAEDETVTVTSDDDKLDLARKIVAKRRAS